MTALRIEDIEEQEEHWIIAYLVGKGPHIRSVPVAEWAGRGIDDCLNTTHSGEPGPLHRLLTMLREIGITAARPQRPRNCRQQLMDEYQHYLSKAGVLQRVVC